MRRSAFIGITVLIVAIIGGLSVGLYFLLRSDGESVELTTPLTDTTSTPTTIRTSTLTQSVTTEAPTTLIPSKGAVATSTDECTDIAVEILQRGGSAVDSAIAATFCQGLTVPQSSGLGGGFIATIYIKETGVLETINSREVAPLAAFKDMYTDVIFSREGGLAIAVPGELKGLFELHKKYGRLSWTEILQPVIDVAENGYKVSRYLAAVFAGRGPNIMGTPGYR